MNKSVWQIPKEILDNTASALTSKDSEVFVIWTASLDMKDDVYNISRYVVPKQDAGFMYGAYVHIEGEELSRIVFDNYKRGERSIIQIHTHPSANVNMSQLDREWEVVNHIGALSIIVPNYGKNGLNGFPGVNVYEREERDWRLWEKEEVRKRLIIV